MTTKDAVQRNATDDLDQKPSPNDSLVQTQHSVTIDGQTVPYTATAGTIVLKEESEKQGAQEGESEGEKAKATIFFVAYVRNDVTDPATRPVTFSFNGGPGSSSVWLHLGVLGPRRVLLDEQGLPLPPPYRLEDNEASLLDVTDLVFIDPVSTGFSRPVMGEKAKEFHDFRKDIESIGDFIRLYATRYGRWLSPKYLIGESYGTTRAAGLSGYLQERHGMYLNGIMLVSMVLDFQTILFQPGNDLPYIIYLPAYAATAWYHQRLPDELQQWDLEAVLEEVSAFALGGYASALLQGANLSADVRATVVKKLARYTGLSPDYVERSDLRIEILRFAKELLRDQGRTVGRLDSRYTGIDRDSAGEHFEHDPSMSAILGAYTATFNDYVRNELRFESDLPYEVLSKLYEHWSYQEFENQYVNVAETLRKAIAINPHLKVHVACGIYDLATPYLGAEYTVSHLGLDSSLLGNISTSTYQAGHMMYVHKPSLQQLKEALKTFVEAS